MSIDNIRRWKYIEDEHGRYHEYAGKGAQFPVYIYRPEYSDDNLPPEWDKRVPAFQKK